MDPTDSCRELVGRLAAKDDVAEKEFFQRYVTRLVGLASSHIPHWLRRKVDPESVAQEVLSSFYKRQRDGQFQVENWDKLWSLLAKITIAKCVNRVRYWEKEKRDASKEVNTSGREDTHDPLERVLDDDPSPDEAMSLTETIEGLMRPFDPQDQRALTMMLQGYSIPEIAERLDRSETSLRRVRERAEARLVKSLNATI